MENAFCIKISRKEGARINIHTLYKWMWTAKNVNKNIAHVCVYGWNMMFDDNRNSKIHKKERERDGILRANVAFTLKWFDS